MFRVREQGKRANNETGNVRTMQTMENKNEVQLAGENAEPFFFYETAAQSSSVRYSLIKKRYRFLYRIR